VVTRSSPIPTKRVDLMIRVVDVWEVTPQYHRRSVMAAALMAPAVGMVQAVLVTLIPL